MMRGVRWLAVGAVVVLAPTALGGQQPDDRRTVEEARVEANRLEQSGEYAEAAAAFARGLRLDPANGALLLGLERTLSRVGRVEEALPAVERALEFQPTSELLRNLQFRIGVRVGGADSAAPIVARWIAAVPTGISPYREWARWLAQRGENDAALVVLRQAQTKFGEDALADVVAPVLAQADRWVEAASQWGLAVVRQPSFQAIAAASLGRAPERVHSAMLGELLDAVDPEPRWLAADLLATWGRSVEGWTLLASTLPPDPVMAIRLIARFADRAGAIGADDALLARGYALERLAQLSGGVQADRARLQAAQAFAEAGNLTAAQRMLSQVSLEGGPDDRAASRAIVTFIRVLAESGQIEDAVRLYDEWESRLPEVAKAELREYLAWGWIRTGELERAEAMVDSGSTIGALAIQGWLALYRGDLRVASERLRAAGPFAQDRAATTRTAEVLALLQRVQREHVPTLGQAFAAALRGDTVAAVSALIEVGRELPPTAGGADALALAGRWARGIGDERAEAVLLESVERDAAGPAAPGAVLELARLYVAEGRSTEALERVEYLILTYPESAVVPQARRLLDRLRGMVPRT
jgi:tetratricopeptide (TPR) repeat protein